MHYPLSLPNVINLDIKKRRPVWEFISCTSMDPHSTLAVLNMHPICLVITDPPQYQHFTSRCYCEFIKMLLHLEDFVVALTFGGGNIRSFSPDDWTSLHSLQDLGPNRLLGLQPPATATSFYCGRQVSIRFLGPPCLKKI